MKTMKKPDMPSREAFRALYPPQDEGYMRAVRQTLANLESEREVRPVMKKKISFAVALAAALVFALACTTVAAGMGVFGKIGDLWDGRNDLYALDEKSVPVGQTHVIPADGVCPEVRLTLAQSYYDGESLYISYEGTGLLDVTDTAWRPTPEELARMQIDPEWDGTGLVPGATPAVPVATPMPATVSGEEPQSIEEGGIYALMRALLDTAAREGSAGAAVYSTYVSDGVYLSETDEYLNLSMSEDVTLNDGTYIGVREFEKPLLDAARGRDEISLYAKVYRHVTYHYYDGEHWYILRDFENRQEHIAPFTVTKNTEESADTRTVERAFEDYEVGVELVASELKLKATITVTNLNGIAVLPDEPNPGDLYDYRILVNGKRASMISGEFGAVGNNQIMIIYEFELPDGALEQVVFVPVYEGENGERIEREEEAVTFEFGA